MTDLVGPGSVSGEPSQSASPSPDSSPPPTSAAVVIAAIAALTVLALHKDISAAWVAGALVTWLVPEKSPLGPAKRMALKLLGKE